MMMTNKPLNVWLKNATVSKTVPATLSHTGEDLQPGYVVEYTHISWPTGREPFLVLADGRMVSALFFDWD